MQCQEQPLDYLLWPCITGNCNTHVCSSLTCARIKQNSHWAKPYLRKNNKSSLEDAKGLRSHYLLWLLDQWLITATAEFIFIIWWLAFLAPLFSRLKISLAPSIFLWQDIFNSNLTTLPPSFVKQNKSVNQVLKVSYCMAFFPSSQGTPLKEKLIVFKAWATERMQHSSLSSTCVQQ